MIGATSAVAGWLGVAGGGAFSDWLKQRNPKARPLTGTIASLCAIPFGVVFLLADNVMAAYVFNFVFTALSAAWIGSAVALANDLVLPRMRATASAFYILTVTFVGLALGPFLMGWISGTLEAGGADSGRALQLAILIGLGAYAIGAIFFALASRTVAADEETRVERAQAAGEVIETA